MKLNKIFLLAGIAVAGMWMSACSDDDDYTPGQPAGQYDVSFVDEGGMAVLALEDRSVTFTLTRANGEGELTVPLEVVQKPDFVQIPSSATFKAGETETEVKATIGEGMENFVEYVIRVNIPENLTNPYADASGSPMYNMVILKEDYAPWAEGVFAENVLFGQEWEQTLEYSAIKEIYRLPNLIAEGTHFYFKWDGTGADDQTIYFCDADGKKTVKFATGYVHAKYGMVMANILADKNWMGFDETDNTFRFPIEMTVSAGSFGAGYDTYTITSRY